MPKTIVVNSFKGKTKDELHSLLKKEGHTISERQRETARHWLQEVDELLL